MPKEIAFFLIGYVAAKKDLIYSVHTNAKGWGIFILVCIGLIVCQYLFDPYFRAFVKESPAANNFFILAFSLLNFLQSMAYIVGVFLLLRFKFFRNLLKPFQYCGRMSLTNYLGQTLICVIFFNYMGFYGTFKPSDLAVLAIAIFICQLLFSYIWFKYYNNGPLEMSWRYLIRKVNNPLK